RRGPPTGADFTAYLDGRTPAEGVADFLASRGAALPAGHPADPPGEWTAAGLGARQDQLFAAALAADPPRAYPGSVALLERLRAGRVPVLLATSAPHAEPLLAAVGLDGAFDQ
ncbi:HAD family hydrolase, partial [Klebsiella pneumoniae]